MVGVGQTTGIPKEYTYQPSQLGMENIKTFTEMPTAIARLKDSIPIAGREDAVVVPQLLFPRKLMNIVES